MALERKLEALKYDPGEVDGSFDKITGYAVMAFQKVKGMDRTGRATDDVIAAVNATEGTPPALVTGGPPHRVEVDIDRQVLFLYEGGQISTILPVSIRVEHEVLLRGLVPQGGHAGRVLRGLPRPAGAGRSGRWAASTTRSTSTAAWPSTAPSRCPPVPASHGCVRIPMNAAEWFPSKVGVGTAVYVLGPGDQINVPPPAPAPGEPLPTGATDPTCRTRPAVDPSILDLLTPTTTVP